MPLIIVPPLSSNSNQPSVIQRTHLGNYWMESGPTPATLIATFDGTTPVPVQWSVQLNDPSLLSMVNPPGWKGGPYTFTVNGFGKTTIAATTGTEWAFLDLYIGSVLIAGMDGRYWQVHSDGSTRRVDQEDLALSVKGLVHSPAQVADLTATSTATAVTCYLLNIRSIPPGKLE